MERNRFESELKEALETISNMKAKISTMTDTIHEGDTMRRKLHNTIQELKVFILFDDISLILKYL